MFLRWVRGAFFFGSSPADLPGAVTVHCVPPSSRQGGLTKAQSISSGQSRRVKPNGPPRQGRRKTGQGVVGIRRACSGCCRQGGKDGFAGAMRLAPPSAGAARSICQSGRKIQMSRKYNANVHRLGQSGIVAEDPPPGMAPVRGNPTTRARLGCFGRRGRDDAIAQGQLLEGEECARVMCKALHSRAEALHITRGMCKPLPEQPLTLCYIV